MTTTKRLTARQLTAKLANMDLQIARLEVIVNDFHSIAELADGPVSDEIGNAFNAATDALDADPVQRGAGRPRSRPPYSVRMHAESKVCKRLRHGDRACYACPMNTNSATVVLTAKGQMSHFSQDGKTTLCGQAVTVTKGSIGDTAIASTGKEFALWASCRKCERHGSRLSR